MKLKFIILGLSLLLTCHSTNAQAPDTNWTRIFDGGDSEVGYDVQQTLNGDYIIVGRTDPPGLNGDLLIIKVDNSGNLIWTKTYGGIYHDEGHSVRQTLDNGFIILGFYELGNGNTELWLLKTDEFGDTLWTQRYGGFSNDEGYSVKQTSDGGYACVGITKSFGAGSKDVWLIKTDSNGDSLWTRTYGAEWEEGGNDIYQTYDNGYIITGYKSYNSVNRIWLIKVNDQGDTLWTRNYGGTTGGSGLAVLENSDNDIILTGSYSYSGGTYFYSDVHLIKTNSVGDLVWDKKIWTTGVGLSVQETSEQGYIVAAKSRLDQTGNTGNLFLIKTNSFGDTLWTRKYLSNKDGVAYSVKQTSDEGFIFTGFVQTEVFNTDVTIVKTKPDTGTVNVQEHPNINLSQYHLIQNYPNPFNPSTTIRFTISELRFTTLKIYDLLGREVATLVNEEKPAGEYEIEFDGTGLPSGIYFYQLRVYPAEGGAGNFTETKKMVLIK
jgi:hypothetical protein